MRASSSWWYSNNTRRRNRFIYPGLVAFAATGVLMGHDDKADPSESKGYGDGLPSWRGDLPTYTYDEVKDHTSSDNGIWVTYGDGVYDITGFISSHPGGDLLLMAAGSSLEPYWDIYTVHKSHETLELLESMRIGNIDASTIPVDEDRHHEEVDEQWMNEPLNRHPALIHNQTKPFNAEPPSPLISAQFYTPNDIFYIRNHLPIPSPVDIKDYKLEITKEGSNEEESICLSFDDLMKFPQTTISAALQCGGNRRSNMSSVRSVKGLSWGEGAIGNATWTGVRLCDVLKHAGADDTCYKHVQFEGRDQDPMGSSYGASIPIEVALNPLNDVLLVFKMNGEDLPVDHGHPVRVLVPGAVGARSVKWLSRIILSSEESQSIWQRRDYKIFPSNVTLDNVDYESSPAMQEMPVQSAICSPIGGTMVEWGDGTITIRGYAYSGGGKGIWRVDVSIDGGKEWVPAQIQNDIDQPHNRKWSWCLWKVTIPLKEMGSVDIICKAIDSSCNTQPERPESIWNFRGLANNSWHHVNVNVVKK
jgi:sulfite oxidase